MSSQQANTSSFSHQTTFGVEWEFLLCYFHPGNQKDHDNYADAISTAYPGTVIIPYTIKGTDAAVVYIRQGTIATLRENGIDINGIDSRGKMVVPPTPGRAASQPHRFYLNTAHEKYFRWTMTTDGSVLADNLQAGRDAPVEQQKLDWAPLELISPAMRNEAASYVELERAVDLIKAEYRVRVNKTCGLHVHTAFGRDQISAERLRRCAALLFAVDLVVAEIHPRHRRDNVFAGSIRTSSNAAMGWTALDAVKGFENLPSNQYSWFRKRRGESKVRIRDAVREIMACPTVGAIAWIMRTEYTDANYNFAKIVRTINPNPTLEFRQHDGTLDARRMSAWARFCAGIFRYAVRDLTQAKLDEVVAFCERAEKDKSGKLHLYELLESLGMTCQARDLGLRPSMRTDPDDLVDLDKLTLDD
ncbi:hypothetical protein PG997_011714 [Apiospora hydei]|uniref:Amidoligase enzyme n=1 Tax=Apiospora hydei TaxID=1337664 RepID=A0ABR1V199_9PEZI